MANDTSVIRTSKALCDCVVGNPYFDENGVCRCTADANTYYDAPIKGQPSGIQTVKPRNLNTLSTSIVDWVKAHPFIVAGGLGLLFYFFFIMRKRSSSRFIR